MSRALAIAVLALAGVAAAPAAEPVREFDGPDERARYYELIDELRCLVCQNESLASSQADLAADMRDEVYRLVVVEDRSREAAVEFLVARYGDFVRYRPPLRPATWLLWFGPAVLLAVAAVTAAGVIRRRRRAAAPALSAAEHARARRLLAGDDAPADDEERS